MRFVETTAFTAALRRYVDDEGYRQLQVTLMLRPGQGKLIPGAGGLRKIRWSTGTTGKRGGLRVIYYWASAARTFYMLYAYAKAAQDELSPEQARRLGRLVREEFE
jgi:hypothetical protein